MGKKGLQWRIALTVTLKLLPANASGYIEPSLCFNDLDYTQYILIFKGKIISKFASCIKIKLYSQAVLYKKLKKKKAKNIVRLNCNINLIK